MWAPGTGVPMGGHSSTSGATRCEVTTIEVSVGPYWLYSTHRGWPARKRRSAAVTCKGSPHCTTSRSAGSSGAASIT